MIYFFGEEYVKKMMGCQGGIELTVPQPYDNFITRERRYQSAASPVYGEQSGERIREGCLEIYQLLEEK